MITKMREPVIFREEDRNTFAGVGTSKQGKELGR